MIENSIYCPDDIVNSDHPNGLGRCFGSSGEYAGVEYSAADINSSNVNNLLAA